MPRLLKVVLIIIAVLAALIILLRILLRRPDISLSEDYDDLLVTSASFIDGVIPEQYSGNGEDISPQVELSTLHEDAVSIVVIMDDIDHPLFGVYCHWLIWNIPPMDAIPEGVPHGAAVPELGAAVTQGSAYGRQRYRGPKPPFGSHRYKYNVFVLDTMLQLDSSSNKEDLLSAMQGHVLQYGFIVGRYP